MTLRVTIVCEHGLRQEGTECVKCVTEAIEADSIKDPRFADFIQTDLFFETPKRDGSWLGDSLFKSPCGCEFAYQMPDMVLAMIGLDVTICATCGARWVTRTKKLLPIPRTEP